MMLAMPLSPEGVAHHLGGDERFEDGLLVMTVAACPAKPAYTAISTINPEYRYSSSYSSALPEYTVVSSTASALIIT